MPIAKNRAEILASLRGALRFVRHAEGEVEARGEGEQSGVAMTWARTTHADGSILVEVSGPLGLIVGFDGKTGWAVDPSGMPRAIDLADLDELIVTTRIADGQWLAEDSFVEDVVSVSNDTIVLVVRRDQGGTRFRLTIDAKAQTPRTLERLGREDHTYRYDDWFLGPYGMVPRRIILREGWLEDVSRLAAIEGRRTAAADYGVRAAEPEDVTVAEGSPLTWRTTRRRLPVVSAEIDDGSPGWFLLDTGAGSLAVDTAVAAGAKLAALGRRLVRTADGVAGAPHRRAGSLRVGPMTIANPLFLELDLQPFSRALGLKLAGVLGYDLFRRATVTIDGDAGATLVPRRLEPNPTMGDEAVPLRFEGSRPVIEARFPSKDGPQRGLFAIDTGSASAVTVHAGAAPRFATKGGARSSLQGLSGAADARARSLPWFEIGGHRFEDVDALVAGGGAGVTGDTSPDGVLGSLGMGLLRDLTMTLDYAGRRVLLHRRKKEPLRARPR